MSPNEDEETSNPSSNNMEHECKVNIEETSVNLSCVKRELEEFEFTENRYRIALNYENMFGESLKEQRNNIVSLIGFLDDDVVMETETGTIKLEDVKDENKNLIRKIIEQSYCDKCGGNYEGYCSNCSSLLHILNNLNPNINPEPDLNTTPINVLEIREVLMKRAVFALKTLPKGIILGPFKGIAPIESTTGLQWKIKDEKLVTDENGNWMKYIESVTNHVSKNLEVLQIDRLLYFETSREIQEGEELLVCYREEEEVLKSNKDEVFYLVPVKKEEYPKVFACTRCCLGFRLESCLMEHKSKCPQGDHGANIEDFEIIQCRCCKVWLEKQEHLKSHMMHCLDNYNKLCQNIPGVPRRPAGEIDEAQGLCDILTPIDEDRGYLTQTDVIHSKYSDGIGKTCSRENFCEKEHKCSKCPYKTNRKDHFHHHLNTHNDIKPFECDICKNRFNYKSGLNQHIRSQHSNTSEKKYKCSECSYQTSYKGTLVVHLNTHMDIKQFQCNICKKRFAQKGYMKYHIIKKHFIPNEKEHKCSECSYETNEKRHLKRHLNTHNDIKPYECDICKMRFGRNFNLKRHIIAIHSNTSRKEYQCSECTYQANREDHLIRHLRAHHDIEFECDICKKRFSQKSHLKQHMKNKHSIARENVYKCSDCSYQTIDECNLHAHLNTHTDIKAFECDICKARFNQKSYLNDHIRNKHSIPNERK